MKGKILRTLIVFVAFLMLPATAVHANEQGTDGTELQVVKAEQLEIHLGEDFVGMEFTLELEYGMYPGTVRVGQDGVLRMEIGGSSKYVLCAAETMIPETLAPPVTALEDTVQQSDPPEELPPADIEMPVEMTVWYETTVGGIPVSHLLFFGMGLILAAGILFFLGHRRTYVDDDYEDGF